MMMMLMNERRMWKEEEGRIVRCIVLHKVKCVVVYVFGGGKSLVVAYIDTYAHMYVCIYIGGGGGLFEDRSRHEDELSFRGWSVGKCNRHDCLVIVYCVFILTAAFKLDNLQCLHCQSVQLVKKWIHCTMSRTGEQDNKEAVTLAIARKYQKSEERMIEESEEVMAAMRNVSYGELLPGGPFLVWKSATWNDDVMDVWSKNVFCNLSKLLI